RGERADRTAAEQADDAPHGAVGGQEEAGGGGGGHGRRRPDVPDGVEDRQRAAGGHGTRRGGDGGDDKVGGGHADGIAGAHVVGVVVLGDLVEGVGGGDDEVTARGGVGRDRHHRAGVVEGARGERADGAAAEQDVGAVERRVARQEETRGGGGRHRRRRPDN